MRTSAEELEIIKQAQRTWAEKDLDIQLNAPIARTARPGRNPGHWVQAWVWVEEPRE